jgi:transposase
MSDKGNHNQTTCETIEIPIAEYNKFKNLEYEVLYLTNQIEQFRRMIFGSKSERFVPNNDGQLKIDFGPEFEKEAEPKVETESISYTRKKKSKKEVPGHGRALLPAHLPRKEEVILPEGDLEGKIKIGEAVTEILEFEPGSLFVRRIVRPKYAEENGEGVVIADMPSLPIPKGNAGPSLLSHINVSKFVDHIPFYRLREMLKRQEVVIAESTLNNWHSGTCNLLQLLYEKHIEEILRNDYLQGDESPIKVQTREKKGSTHLGYQWVYYSTEKKMVCFDYRKGRGRAGPEDFLKNFRGFLQTDGYIAYDGLKTDNTIVLLSCMAHARRKFEHALDNDRERASWALKKIQRLYHCEAIAREAGMSYEERKKIRTKKSARYMAQLEKWLKEQLQQVLPKSAIRTAIAYTLNLWPRLMRYLDDGRFEIDNNLIENSIRPMAIGRKNYMFAGSHTAAERAAMMYSFFGTCKLHKIDPQKWLTDVLTRIQDHKAKDLWQLLPQHWTPLTPKTGNTSPQ